MRFSVALILASNGLYPLGCAHYHSTKAIPLHHDSLTDEGKHQFPFRDQLPIHVGLAPHLANALLLDCDQFHRKSQLIPRHHRAAKPDLINTCKQGQATCGFR